MRCFVLQVPAPVFQAFMSLVGDAMELHGAPYHGIYHAVDCAQTLLVFLNTFGADKFFSPLEAFALLIAALCHDLEHPGLSVTYQENAQVKRFTFRDYSAGRAELC